MSTADVAMLRYGAGIQQDPSTRHDRIPTHDTQVHDQILRGEKELRISFLDSAIFILSPLSVTKEISKATTRTPADL